MHVEAGDRVHHRCGDDVDRQVRGRLVQDVVQTTEPVFQHQH